MKGSGGYHPSRIPATWRRPTPRGVTLGAVGSPWSTRLSTPARDFARDCRRHPTRRRLAPPSSPSLSRKPRRRFYPPNPPRTPEERQRPNPRGARLSSLGTFTVGPSPAEGSQITNRRKRTFQGAPHDLLTFCLCRLPLHAGRARVFGERVRSKRRQDPGAQHVRSDREGFHRLTCPQPPRTPHQAEATHHGQHAYQQADDTAAQQRARRKLDHDGARGERNVAPQLVTPYEGAA